MAIKKKERIDFATSIFSKKFRMENEFNDDRIFDNSAKVNFVSDQNPLSGRRYNIYEGEKFQ